MARLGADVEALEDLSRRFTSAADVLDRHTQSINGSARVSWWLGPDADRFRSSWSSRLAPDARLVVARLRDEASRLQQDALQQRRASGGFDAGGGTGPWWTAPGADEPSERARLAEDRISGWLDTGGWGVTRSDLDNIRDELAGLSPEDRSAAIMLLSDHELDVLWDQMREGQAFRGRAGGFSQGEMAAFYRQVAPGLSPAALDRLLGPDALGDVQSVGFVDNADATPRESIAQTIDSVGSPGQNGIEIRLLDNGSAVVLLPGVTDLSSSLSNPLEWRHLDGENPTDSPRDMHYAGRVAQGDGGMSENYENAYAFMVRSALAKADIPPGTDVMLVGHSFGAYTAVELASDPTFNGGEHGYNVTNVIAAGADVDWMADGVPAETDLAVFNSANDKAFLVESALLREGDPATNVIFNGGDVGHGHDIPNYSEGVRTGYLDDYIDRIPEQYLGSGERFHVDLHDPYRQAE